MRQLAEHVCTVIDARPVDQGSDSDDGSSSIGPTSDVEAAGTAAVTNSPTVLSATAARLAARQRAKDQAEKEQNDARERLESVSRKLSLLLLGSDKCVDGGTPMKAHQLDAAFIQYTQMLGASPTALQRDWKTGQTVLEALNGLHGEDEMKVYSGIQTRKGCDLYLRIVRDLSKGNKHKVTAKAIATEWNVRVEQLLAQTQGNAAKEQIRREFGFIGTKDAQRHGDRLKLRVEQTQHAGSICESLIEFCSSIKELSVRVEEVQIPTVVQPAGVRGPAAVVMQTSALKIAPKRPAEDDEMDEAATKNNCYLCSLNGRALTECCILVPGSKPTQYLNGHNRKRAQVVCEWFDGKYKEGSAERAAKVAEAGRVRGNALKLFAKRKKKMKSTS